MSGVAATASEPVRVEAVAPAPRAVAATDAQGAECPRCGYDLAGALASWERACPLEGSCPECGLGLRWSEVLAPLRLMPRWFLEHPYRSVWRTFAPTLVRTARAWRFWTRVRIEQPIRTRRLAAYVLLLLVLAHLCVAAVAAWDGYEVARMARPVPVLGGIPAVGQLFQVPPSSKDGFREALLSALWPYTLDEAYRYNREVSSPLLIDEWVRLALLWTALAPVGYLVLRQTFARTKLRWGHLARIAAYSAGPVVAMALVYTGMVLAYVTYGPHSTPLRFFGWVDEWAVGLVLPSDWLLMGTGVWLVAWWYAATRRYLRLRHAAGVAAAMVAIGGLGALLAIIATDASQIAAELF